MISFIHSLKSNLILIRRRTFRLQLDEILAVANPAASTSRGSARVREDGF